MARFARKCRFLFDQERRLGAGLKKLRAKQKTIGNGWIDVTVVRVNKRYKPLARLFLTARTRRVNRQQLGEEIAALEAERERVRNERQLCNSQFENANQKATQYINMLASVLKTLNEMNTGIIRNLR